MGNPHKTENPPQMENGSVEVLGTVSIQNQGCKLNQADSEALARRFVQAGYRVVGPSEPADIHIINTCTVTHVADSKARQALRTAHRENPSALVVATGCYSQRAPKELARVEGVGLVVGNSEKDHLVEMVLAARGDQLVACAVGEDPPPFFTLSSEQGLSKGLAVQKPSPMSRVKGFGRSRAMVKIQEGCNQVCAYCIVPRVRGRESSIPPEMLVRQVSQRVEEGYKEVVLTGTQLGSYGFDLAGANLKGLLERLLGETGVKRLRVSSLQPQEITWELLGLWDDPRLCPHFHMPLQSGSDHVLKRMRRRYTAAQYAEAVERVRASVPGVAITADVIVGFPGEEEWQFRESLEIAEKMGFASMHVFPYSVRPGTSAAYMEPRVDERAKRGRMEEMLALAGQQASTFRRRSIGTTRWVLWERADVREGRPVYLGLTDNYLKVYTEQDISLLNQITSAQLVAEVGESLLAEVPQGIY